ncbi:M23 family metallopeptidase [Cyanobacteria bacterium FACHB-472]|nr:M23 family metallopeptidase [Cyanobacteria bacterium FACHB-472]
MNGWLGAPTSAEVPQGNGVVKQTFEGGYIIWNGRTATAYRTGTNNPGQQITSTPTPAPALHSNPTPSNPLSGFVHPLSGKGGITQGNNGSTSHSGRSAYAYDYGVKIGTPVYAMRSGKVVQVKDGYPDTGGGESNKNRANYVVIQHENGYRSAYLHLKQGFSSSTGVYVGKSVSAGQLIGYSGNSGWSTGPHLHVEVHTGNWGNTVPFKIG